MKNRICCFLVTLIMLAALAAVPFTAASAQTPDAISEDTVAYYLMPYLIVKGDTISDIYHCWGLRYENYAAEICSLNALANLDDVQAGWLLYLPTNGENLMGLDYTTVMAHTMEKGETAYDVCADYGIDFYKCEERIRKFNPNTDLTKLKAGQTLHIPLI